RTEAYRQEAGRRDLQAALTFEAFLATLALEVEIASPALPDLARVAQLTQRVNQLTFLPRRRSEAELRALLKRGTLECRVVRVRDRFGDYGLVGAMLFGPAADALDVDTFLLSCRALGRGVEHQMLAALGRLAAERGLARVRVRTVASGRNTPALAFLETIARELLHSAAAQRLPHAGAEKVIELPAHALAKLTFRPPEPAVPPPAAVAEPRPRDAVRPGSAGVSGSPRGKSCEIPVSPAAAAEA